MPKGEREMHPYIELGKIKDATKLILGSFPVYECTDPDTPKKFEKRAKSNSFRFFYGSSRNQFWQLYSKYIDSTLNDIQNPDFLIQSLTERKIAISDTVMSCERYYLSGNKGDESALDSSLRCIEWNVEALQSLMENGITKIICTSKAVLKDLEKSFICNPKLKFGEVDTSLSQDFQRQFIDLLGGNIELVKNPIARVFMINGDQVKAIAIPSPGSPQRQIDKFGCTDQDRKSYSDKYFRNAFTWLNN